MREAAVPALEELHERVAAALLEGMPAGLRGGIVRVVAVVESLSKFCEIYISRERGVEREEEGDTAHTWIGQHFVRLVDGSHLLF